MTRGGFTRRRVEGRQRGVDSELVQTDEIVAKRKIGVIGDTHWGGYGFAGLSPDESTLKSKLDEFATEMQNESVDTVVHLGDVSQPDADSQSTAEQYLNDFRNYLEPQLNVDVNYVLGNHEYVNANSWGTGWSYDELGFSGDSDTYYTVDYPEVKLLIINNSYSTDDGNSNHNLAPNEFSFIEETLQTSKKPIIIFSHQPISYGTGNTYDRLNDKAEHRLPQLFSRYDNILFCVFGHTHHAQGDDGQAKVTFNANLSQHRRGVRHIYQHFPHRLGGTSLKSGDKSFTPFGIIEVAPNGYARYRTSYAGNSTSAPSGPFQEQFEGMTGQRYPSAEERLTRIQDFHHHSLFESLTGWAKSGSGSASITFNYSNTGRATVSTGASNGNSHKIQFNRKVRGLLKKPSNDPGGYPSAIWRASINVPDSSSSLFEFKWGGLGSIDHIGFELENNTLYGSVSDGTQNRVEIGGFEDAVLEFRYFSDIPRVDFYRNYALEKKIPSVTNNIPTGTVGRKNLAQFQATTNEAVDKKMHIREWELYLTPALDTVQ